MFDEGDLKPGDVIEKTVTVTNVSGAAGDITVDLRAELNRFYTELSKTNDLAKQTDFLNQIFLTIRREEDPSPVLGPLLFGDIILDPGNEVSLDTLTQNEQVTYIFKVEFPWITDNLYQDHTANFDLILRSDCLPLTPTPTPIPALPGSTPSVLATWIGEKVGDVLGMLTELPITGHETLVIVPSFIAIGLIVFRNSLKKRN